MDISKYDELNAALKIDILRIDQELIVMAQRIQAASELSIDASDDEHAAKMAYDIATAEASARLRSVVSAAGKPRSEAQIATEVPLDEMVQAARAELDMARNTASKAKALASSMMEKSQLVRKACDMIVAGFITPSSFSPKRAAMLQPRAVQASERGMINPMTRDPSNPVTGG